MSNRIKPLLSRAALSLTCVLLASLVLTFAGCSVHVDDSKENDDVDVKTPFGAIQVHSRAEARDTGLSVYPGARRRSDESGKDKHSANVNISSSMFGVKVVAVEYESEDPPDRLIGYYKNDLKKYGNVLECKDIGGSYAHSSGGDSSVALTCDPAPAGAKKLQLEAGTRGNQHIVSIEPHGAGTRFALVHVTARGQQEPI